MLLTWDKANTASIPTPESQQQTTENQQNIFIQLRFIGSQESHSQHCTNQMNKQRPYIMLLTEHNDTSTAMYEMYIHVCLPIRCLPTSYVALSPAISFHLTRHQGAMSDTLLSTYHQTYSFCNAQPLLWILLRDQPDTGHCNVSGHEIMHVASVYLLYLSLANTQMQVMLAPIMLLLACFHVKMPHVCKLRPEKQILQLAARQGFRLSE